MNYLQKITTGLSLLGSAIIVGLSFNVFDSMLFFLLVGELPGSQTSLHPDTMLALFGCSLLAFMIAVARPTALLRRAESLSGVRQYLPKNRYGSIQ